MLDSFIPHRFSLSEKIDPKLMSDPLSLYDKKTNGEFIKKIKDNETSIGRILKFDTPPKFYNPFHYKVDGESIYPLYSKTPKNLNMKINKYLFRRFRRVNIKYSDRFLSESEINRLNFFFGLKIVSLISTLFFTRRIFVKRDLLCLGVIPSIYLIRLSIKYTMFTNINSYLRNFNGYSNEQIDIIISSNLNLKKSN